MATNVARLEPGLRLFTNEEIRSGRQLDTKVVGIIDLLALDANGDLVVIELKAGEATDRVCGQIQRYMAWVNENIAKGRKVRGMIVANEFSDNLQYAIRITPNVSLKQYAVEFHFNDG